MKQKNGRGDIALKIFSGFHQGACIPLRDLHYTIGQDDSCDFILRDKGIKPKHLVLYYEKQNWFVKPADGKVFIDGEPAMGKGNPVKQRNIVTIGSVHLSLIDVEDDWQPEKWPLIKELGKQEKLNQASSVTVKKNRRTVQAIKIFSAVVAAIAVYCVSQAFIPFKAPDYETKIANIQKMLNSLSVTDATVLLSRDGYIEVVAYAPNQHVKNEIQQKLSTMDVLMRSTIYAEDELEQTAAAYIARMQYPVRAQYQGQGKIIIKGFAWDSEKMMRICEGVKENVPGAFSVQPDMRPLNKIMPVVENILQKNNLDQKLTVQASPDGLVVTGELSPSEQKAWLLSENEMILNLKPDWKIEDNIIYPESIDVKQGRIVMPITGVSLGKKPYVTLQGGRKCFEGGPLKAGMIISRITSNKIIVQIQDREYIYPY
jgi:type III secretion system YscD/HrpQ family protein